MAQVRKLCGGVVEEQPLMGRHVNEEEEETDVLHLYPPCYISKSYTSLKLPLPRGGGADHVNVNELNVTYMHFD